MLLYVTTEPATLPVGKDAFHSPKHVVFTLENVICYLLVSVVKIGDIFAAGSTLRNQSCSKCMWLCAYHLYTHTQSSQLGQQS